MIGFGFTYKIKYISSVLKKLHGKYYFKNTKKPVVGIGNRGLMRLEENE